MKTLGTLLLVSMIFTALDLLKGVDSQVETVMTTSLNGNRYTYASMLNVCPGDEINSICVIEGSRILAWSSDQYIGIGGVELEFTAVDSAGFQRRSDINPNTLATLTSSDTDKHIITSTLHVIVEPSDVLAISSIVCNNRNNGTPASLTLHYLDEPGPPLNPVAIEIENTHNTSGCVISVEWSPPVGTSEADIDHYIVDFPSGESMVTFDSFVSFFLHIHECTEDIAIKLRAVNRCGRVSAYSHDVTPTRLNQQKVTVDIPAGANQNSVPIIIGASSIGLGAILIAVCVVIIILIAVLFCKFLGHKGQEIKQRNQESQPGQKLAPLGKSHEKELLQDTSFNQYTSTPQHHHVTPSNHHLDGSFTFSTDT